VGLLAAGGAVTAGVVGVSWRAAYLGMHPPVLPLEGDRFNPAYYEFKVEDVQFQTSDDVTINAWWIEGTRLETVIVVHGFSSQPAAMLPNIDLLRRTGVNILAPTLRSSPGPNARATSFGIRETGDVIGAVRYVEQRRAPRAAPLALLGTSMGAATVIMTGAREPRAIAVVAEAPYKNIQSIVGHPFRTIMHLPPYPFAPLAITLAGWREQLKMKTISPMDDAKKIAPRPLLVIGDLEDQLLDYHDAIEIYKRAGPQTELWLVPGANHGWASQVDPEGYAARVNGFLERAFAAAANASRPA
jgi:dipeptidyl aminopeptidase/acylaminoacyl peptidase